MSDFPKPLKGAIFYEDSKLYATLANLPITKGHVVIVQKDKIADLHLLKRKDYNYFRDVLDAVRNAMLKTLKIKKVYLLYMAETQHVHWHLIPRYDVQGMNVLEEKPKKLKDVSLAKKYKENLKLDVKNFVD